MNTPPFSKNKTTLCFLLKDNQILLAMKKRGFGVGKWNGTGGKVHANETIENAAIRETQEEIGVVPKRIKRVATLYFHFSKSVEEFGKTEETGVYTCTEWEGDLVETEEMKPMWFEKDDLPFNNMWADDIYWLPRVLNGEKILGNFWFDTEFKLTKHEVITHP